MSRWRLCLAVQCGNLRLFLRLWAGSEQAAQYWVKAAQMALGGLQKRCLNALFVTATSIREFANTRFSHC